MRSQGRWALPASSVCWVIHSPGLLWPPGSLFVDCASILRELTVSGTDPKQEYTVGRVRKLPGPTVGLLAQVYAS